MPWNPDQYERFKSERAQPFHDLASLVEFKPDMRMVDLGCGTGELTAELSGRSRGIQTLGIDSSGEMLEKATVFAADGLEFRRVDIAAFQPAEPFDLVFSNAALQWLPDHERLFPQLLTFLAPGGQIAVQMPANHHHPSHTLARELASSPLFETDFQGFTRSLAVMPAEWYAEFLYRSGASRFQVFEKIYGHTLSNTDAIVEWVKGTLLVPYLERLSPQKQEAFLNAYRAGLKERIGDSSPVFYPFRRMLMAARF